MYSDHGHFSNISSQIIPTILPIQLFIVSLSLPLESSYVKKIKKCRRNIHTEHIKPKIEKS